jgi:hypothetical protein
MSLLTPTNALRLIGLITLGMLYPMPAHAGGVVSCENCANPRQTAIASGIGLTVVADVSGRKLLAFDVEYDRELHRYRALPVAIPDEVNATFHRLLRLMEVARESPGDAGSQARGRSAIVPVHPDDPSNTNGITFPDAFKSLTASDVVISATHRSGLETAIGTAFCGSDTRSAVWNALSTTLTSIVVSVASRLTGVDSVTYVITWRDGSITRLVVAADAVDRARYQPGQSRDPEGNVIPDGASTNPETGPDLAGTYTFSDEQTLNNWLNAAYIYGVQVDVAEHSLPVSIVCRWNGRTLECEVPR